jgi:triosephosphate isomerase (TIM)
MNPLFNTNRGKKTMRKKLIAGNWKMNLTIAESAKLANDLHAKIQAAALTTAEVVIAPTFIALNKVADLLKGSTISVAAQDLFWEDAGAYTGQVAAPMIKDAGAKYVIIGHSERRQYFYETNESVNKKIFAALKHQLVPIVCVGETLAERETNKVEEVIATQLQGGLKNVTANDMQNMVIAYEPIWAIGTGKTATPEQAEEVHAMIRAVLSELFGVDTSQQTKILYGGSVKASNSKELLSRPNIDGALVGGASLKADEFVGIIQSAIHS